MRNHRIVPEARRYCSTHSGRQFAVREALSFWLRAPHFNSFRTQATARRRRSPLGESPHQGRHVYPRGHLGDELLDLALGPMRRPPQKRLPVVSREVGRQVGDPAQVKPPVAQHRKDHRVLARGSGHGDAQVGLGLREVQGLRAVGEHGGEGFTSVEASLVHLGDVGDEVGLDAARLGEDLGQAAEEIAVGDRRERSACLGEGRSALVVHGRRLSPGLDSRGPIPFSDWT